MQKIFIENLICNVLKNATFSLNFKRCVQNVHVLHPLFFMTRQSTPMTPFFRRVKSKYSPFGPF